MNITNIYSLYILEKRQGDGSVASKRQGDGSVASGTVAFPSALASLWDARTVHVP